MTTKHFINYRVLWLLIPLLTLFNLSALGTPTTYTFNSSIPTTGWTTSGSSQTINSISWTYSSSTYIGANATRIQVGSAKNPQTTDWTIQTAISNFGSGKKITAVAITAYTTATTATYDISVGGSSVKSGSLTTSSATYTASSLNVTSGNIIITMTGSSESKAMYLNDISVTYDDAVATPHTITFNAGSGSCGTSTSGSVTSYTLPSASPSASCALEGWVFAGWKESSSQSETTTFPVLYAAGTTYSPASDITLYAVYYLPSTSYKKITNTNLLLKGCNYVIAYYYNSNYNALKNTTDGSGYIQTQTVSPSTDVVSSPAAAVVWELKGSAGAWQLYNASAEKYMRVGTSPYVSTTSENIEISVSSNLFKFKNGSKYLIFYSDLTAGGSTTDDYNTYYTYRQQGTFNSNPTCASCDDDPTIGAASLNGSFSLSSVGVRCPTSGTAVQDNCEWEDYGFVWGTNNTGTRPDLTSDASNKVQTGTSGTGNTWDDDLESTFTTGITYYYRAYGENGHGLAYGDVASFTPYKVYYNANGGTGSIDDQIVNTGGSVTLSDGTGFSKDGYHITKWALGSASGTQSDPSSSSGSVTANKEYYAIWTANTYTVTFDKNGGSGDAMSGQAFTYGTAQNLSANTYAAPAHKYFIGWNTDKDATTALYEDGESVNNLTTENSGTVTLYAIWKDHTYTNYRTNCCTKAMLAFDEDEYEDQIRQDQHGSVGSTNKFELDIPFTTSSTGTSYTTEIKKLTYGSRDKSAAGSSCTDETAASVNSSTSPKTVTFQAWSTNPGENYKGQGTYRIKLIQAADGDYCQGVDYVFVDVVMRDKFVDAVNGNTTINRDGTGSAVTTPAEASLTETDECHETTRRLLGWIKETDLESWYGSTSRVSDLDDKKNDSKIVAPNTDVKASAVTWYAVWGEEVAP